MNTVAVRDQFFEVFVYGGALALGFFIAWFPWPAMLVGLVICLALYGKFFLQDRLAALCMVIPAACFFVGFIFGIFWFVIT